MTDDEFRLTYTVSLPQTIAWGEMDAYKHVNNIYYFRYFENARMAYFEKAGINTYKREQQIGPILGSTDCRYLKALTYPDELIVAVRVSKIREKRFTMQYGLYSKNYNALAANGSGEIVFVDYAVEQSCLIPECLVENIKAMERRSNNPVG